VPMALTPIAAAILGLNDSDALLTVLPEGVA
jgi:hypothetical protein